jgi:adenylate cyclase
MIECVGVFRANAMQRRLAAILVADVVGYSGLMERDEAGTLSAVKSDRAQIIEPRITAQGGRIVKSMGDGLLVEFASAVAAVRCAKEIQDAIAADGLRYRVGVHLGDVIVENEDLFGDCVNIAARLEGLAPPGGICLSDRVYEEARGKVDLDCEDLGEVPLKNIARSLRVYRVRSAFAAPVETSVEVVLERPALAVLPFDSMGGDSGQGYFADGLTEDLITALSLWRWFPVVARNSTLVYKSRPTRVQQVAAELGVRYVVEGAVRKGGERVRVSVQLIDAKTGHHLWAEKYDRNLTDMFAVLDEITQQIAAAIVPELETSERRRASAKPPRSLDAWDCWQQGMAYKNELTRDAFFRAKEMFERATALDPTFAQPHTWLAWLHQDDHDELFISPPEEALANWLSEARKAISLDRNDAWAHVALGLGLRRAGRLDEAIAALEEAIEINPSHSFAYVTLGAALGAAGSVEQGISMIEKGIRLNPRDPMMSFIMLQNLAFEHLKAQHHEEAIVWARKSIQQRPDNPIPYVALASSLGHLDRIEEGRSALEACEGARPGYLDHMARTSPSEHVLDGLRKCGWSDH